MDGRETPHIWETNSDCDSVGSCRMLRRRAEGGLTILKTQLHLKDRPRAPPLLLSWGLASLTILRTQLHLKVRPRAPPLHLSWGLGSLTKAHASIPLKTWWHETTLWAVHQRLTKITTSRRLMVRTGTSYQEESVQTWGWGWATRDCSRNDDSRGSPVTVAVATVKRSVHLTAGCFQWHHCGLQVHGRFRASACSGLHLVAWTRYRVRRRRWGGCLGRDLPRE